MKIDLKGYARNQDGFTLVEVVIASAITLLVMTGLTSLVLTAVRAANIATSRIEASSQIRNFQLNAYDDFARSGVPNPSSCGTVSNQCTTEPIVLTGMQVSNATNPVALGNETVTYTWDGALFLDRAAQAGPASHVASGVKPGGFTWYVEGRTVVVNMTVTVQSYSESQTLRFWPRLNP